MSSREFLALFALATVLALAAGACSARPKFELGGACDLTTDCAAPYVCRLDACRQECRERRDCSPGLLCIQDAEGFGVCQKPEERECSLASDCGGVLECRFGTCTNECASNRDCLNGLVCAEGEEGEQACIDPTMKECIVHSDCDEPLICARDRRCREECQEHRDCRDGTSCGLVLGFRTCVVAPADAGADGAVDAAVDASADGAMDAAVDAPLDAPADSGTDSAMAVAPPPPSSVVLSTGHGCRTAGTDLRCWGDNTFGQVGIGSTTGPEDAADVLLPGSPRWLAVGQHHSCALGDAVYCWGSNTSFQLGVTSGGPTRPLTAVSLPAGVVGVAAGASHSCAWTPTSIHCWGSNEWGKLGDPAVTTPTATPTSLTIGGGVVHVALGDDYSCALRGDGRVLCWGQNDLRQLADGTSTPRPVPTETSVTGAASLSAGRSHTCALLLTGEVTCWGDNDDSQLGRGFTSAMGEVPAVVAGLGTAVQVVTGTAHTCVRELAGTVQCFGNSSSRQAGTPVSFGRVLVPGAMQFTGAAAEIFAGEHCTCANLMIGGSECIGRNQSGVFGDLTAYESDLPRTVTW